MYHTSCSNLVYTNKGNSKLLNCLNIKINDKILDCGCGAGDNAQYLMEKGAIVTGITISIAEKGFAEKFCRKVHLANLETGIPDEITDKFDYIIMSHVLEHLVNPIPLLNDSKRLLQKNGRLVIALPNFLIYYNRLKILKGNFKYTDGGIMDETHVRFYSPSLVNDLILNNGLLIERILNDGEVPFWIFRKILSEKFKLKITNYLTNKYPSLFSYQTIVICRYIC